MEILGRKRRLDYPRGIRGVSPQVPGNLVLFIHDFPRIPGPVASGWGKSPVSAPRSIDLPKVFPRAPGSLPGQI